MGWTSSKLSPLRAHSSDDFPHGPTPIQTGEYSGRGTGRFLQHRRRYNCKIKTGDIHFAMSKFNSLAPGRCGSILEVKKKKKFSNSLHINSCEGTHYEITLRLIPRNITNFKSTLFWVMAWCYQPTNKPLPWGRTKKLGKKGDGGREEKIVRDRGVNPGGRGSRSPPPPPASPCPPHITWTNVDPDLRCHMPHLWATMS